VGRIQFGRCPTVADVADFPFETPGWINYIEAMTKLLEPLIASPELPNYVQQLKKGVNPYLGAFLVEFQSWMSDIYAHAASNESPISGQAMKGRRLAVEQLGKRTKVWVDPFFPSHYWAKTLKGGWAIKAKTQGKRLNRFLSGIGDWCKENRHKAIGEQYGMLSAKLRGHYQYYGVRGNYKMLEVAYRYAHEAWKKWLSRRSSMNPMSWEKFMAKVEQVFALPRPRIVHAF
jgi:hypothetical protein